MSQMPPGPPPAAPPPPPQQPPQPTGYLQLTLQGSMMTSNLITPSVRLNGHPVQVKYGEQVIPLVPGPWHIDVHAQWLRRYGQASMDFQIAEGQTTPVFYAAPFHQFTTGNIGHQKQPRKGVGVLVGILVFAAIMVALLVVAAL